jgi:hypothetical protein
LVAFEQRDRKFGVEVNSPVVDDAIDSLNVRLYVGPRLKQRPTMGDDIDVKLAVRHDPSHNLGRDVG